MRVRVKVVIFLADKSKWGYNYCSYCPAINYPFGCADTPNEVIANVQSYLLKLLCYREIYTNLQNLGWEFTDTSIKVPTFTRRRSCASNRAVLFDKDCRTPNNCSRCRSPKYTRILLINFPLPEYCLTFC